MSHLLLKIALGLLAALFAACVLVIALGWLVISLLKSLLTWRKPALVEAFGQFRQLRKQFGQSRQFKVYANWPQGPAGHDAENRTARDVVDVEVKEIAAPNRPDHKEIT